MRIKSMMTKILIASVLSSVVNLIAALLINVTAALNSAVAANITTIFLAIVSSVAFAIILVYLLHIYHANGEGEVWEDYPKMYGGLIKDIPKVISKESFTLLLIFSVSAFNLILWIVNHTVIQNQIIDIIVELFIPVSSLSRLFPLSSAQQALGYLAGVSFTCTAYIIIFTLLRWKWRRFM